MDKFDLTDIPIPDRELMEINQNQVKDLLLEIERLQKIANQKTDPKASASAKKRLANTTRALADVIETPELFADYTPTKGIKYVGEGYYGKGKSFLESMQLDPKGLTGSKSTLHHNDSLKQLFNAIYHPDPNIRYRVLQGIREAKDGDIGTTLSNLSDADFTGHKLYHTDPVTGKVDWKNRGSTVPSIDPNTPVNQRVKLAETSIQKQGIITSTAEASPAVVNRQTSMLTDIQNTPGGRKVLDVYGSPFDLNLRSIEGIKAVQNLNVQFKAVNGSFRLSFLPGAEEMVKAVVKNPLEAVTGAASNLADPDAIKALFQGKPKEALEKGAMGAGIGAGIAEVLKVNPVQQARLASYASKIPGVASKIPGALSMLGGVAKFVAPIGGAVAGYQLADAILEGSTGEGFVGTIKQVQDKERTAEINEAAVESAAKSKQLAVEKELPKPILDSDTIEKFATDPLNELKYGWKKLTGQV